MANRAIRNRAIPADGTRADRASKPSRVVTGEDVSLGLGAADSTDTMPRKHTRAVKPRTAGSPKGENRVARDRRSPDRSSQPAQLQSARRADTPRSEYPVFLPHNQIGMALFMALSFVIAAGVARTLPDILASIAAIGSVVLMFGGTQLAKIERRAGMPSIARQGLMAVGVIAPMALAGYAYAGWVAAGLAWQWAVASLVCINAAAAALFGTRIISLFSAKIAIWAAFTLVDPSPLMVSAVAGAGIALMLITRLEWKAAEKRRLENEARERVAARAEDILRSFEETGQGWFWETDRRGTISYISPSAAAVLGKTADELNGEPLTTIVDADAGAAEAERTIGFHLTARSAFRDIEVLAANQGDDERYWSLTGRPVYDAFKNFCGFRGHGADLTEKRRSEQQVTRLAHYDSLTGLANRVQMSEALEQILAAPRERDRACTVLMLDLDRFKQVNDTMGHPAGQVSL